MLEGMDAERREGRAWWVRWIESKSDSKVLEHLTLVVSLHLVKKK